MILPQDKRKPVQLALELDARLDDRLTEYAASLDGSDPGYVAVEILRDHLTTKRVSRNGKEKKGKKS